jgi:hypothetical protein
VHLDKLSFERETVWKLADVGFVTLLFLLEDLIFVGAVVVVVVALVWLL